MKKVTLFCLGFLVAVSLFAQKEINDANAEVRNVKGFHAIKVATGIQLVLTQGSTEAVAISAASIEDRNRIKTVVENGVLKIYYDYNLWRLLKNKGDRKLKAYVSIVTIDGIDISSGAQVKVEGTLTGNSINMDASSGGVFNGSVDVRTLDVDQSSGAVIKIAGTTGSLKVDGSSGSIFRGYDLTVDHCDADMSSGSGAQVTVTKELSAEASSGGSVSYKGSGVIRNIKTSSGGNVSKKG